MSTNPIRVCRFYLEAGLRWSARVLAVFLIGLVLVFLLGEGGFDPLKLTSVETIEMVFFFTSCIGMVAAWRWELVGGAIATAAILSFFTTEFVDRMPVILSPDDYDLWLEPDFHGQGRLLEMLKPYPADEMTAYPVSTVVNNPRNEAKECIEPMR